MNIVCKNVSKTNFEFWKYCEDTWTFRRKRYIVKLCSRDTVEAIESCECLSGSILFKIDNENF